MGNRKWLIYLWLWLALVVLQGTLYFLTPARTVNHLKAMDRVHIAQDILKEKYIDE